MAATIRKNERSWAIELISQINQFSTDNDLIIKHAGGESTVSEYRGQSMFPDVILYGDIDQSSVLQGWELKMPDVPITNADFVHDAQRKARALNLNSCVIWNFTHAKLYVLNKTNEEFEIKREWDNHNIKTRDDVQLYKSNWEKTLKSVLTSVNEYLLSGDVKKSFIGDVLTKSSISGLINENKYNVASCLREAAKQDAMMKAELETWWKEIKTEYEGDEEDKFAAYAKTIIINWANRIIFAHLIKRRQKSAFIIDNLNYDSSPHDGNVLFQEITEKSDFYNIFGTIPYNECISQKTWASFVELSLFLKHSPINDISQKILQQVLEDSIRVSKRLVNGQYPTPPVLAEILSRMTIHNVFGECFDGCCGTGTIPSFIINYKKDQIGASQAMATTWASDKFKLPLQIANLAMTSYDTINMPCRIFQQDILKLNPGDEVEIVNPQTGKKENYTLPEFDAIVSNLPFVKASEIPIEDAPIVNAIKRTNNLSGRADYSYYIALHLKNLVKVGGHVGIILSNSFLGTEAGSQFITALREYFDDIRIHISGNGRWFTNAAIVTALLIMRKKSENVEENRNISFFTWKRNLNVIADNQDYQDIIVNSSLLDREIDNTVIRRANYSSEELNKLKQLNISYNSLFADLKWLVRVQDKLTPINSILSVIRGSRRGCDRMFFPSTDSGIEPQFLIQAMKSLKRVNSFIASPDATAFNCNIPLDTLRTNNWKGAYSWIKRFENIVDNYGPLVKRLSRPNVEWYDLQPNEVVEIGTMMNPDDRLFYVRFENPTFINQRIIGFNRKSQDDNIALIHALLNSVLSLFYIEAVGFGRGLGALDISKESISKSYMLNPALITEEQAANIISHFTSLTDRGVTDVDQDLEDSVRYEFDKSVLNAFGISDYYDNIVNSLKAMRKIRKAVKQESILLRQPNDTGIHGSIDEQLILMAAESGPES